jgi:exopolysaccharide biosynthesis polyprenyl glycosylphosphotransferase
MNGTERAALLEGVALHDEMTGIVDERTLEILGRHRRGRVVRRRGWLVRRALATADMLGLAVAFVLAEWWFGGGSLPSVGDRIDQRVEVLLFLFTLPGWVVLAKLYGLYDHDEERTDHSGADDFGGVFHMITVGAWALPVGAWLTNLADPPLYKVAGFWVLAILLVCTLRAMARAYCRRQVAYIQNTVIVGAGDVGQLIAKKYLQHPEYRINLVGFVDRQPKERRPDLGHLTLLGSPDELPSLIRTFDIERVVIAFSNDRHGEVLELIRSLRGCDIHIDVVPRLFEALGPGTGLHAIEGIPLLGVAAPALSRSSQLIKSSLDAVLAAVGLLLLAPVFALLALLIKLDSEGPVFYRHQRVGRGGRRIDVYKFRTMQIEYCRGERYGGEKAERLFAEIVADPVRRAEFEGGYKLKDDPRVTRVGRWLRKSSLDELPQLLNVISGDLSLVGPRPLVEDELRRYGDDVSTLLNIRPGITGYWQINGRSELEYRDRVRLDLAYITNWSLGLDLAILAKTGRTLLLRKGAY